MVVVDIGAEYAYYTADITRTYPVSGKFTPRQREIYQLVLDCQSACAAEFKVGKSTLAEPERLRPRLHRQEPAPRQGRAGGRAHDGSLLHPRPRPLPRHGRPRRR